MNSLFDSGVVLSDSEFEFLAMIIYNNTGIELQSHKKTLLEGRLQKIWRINNIQNFRAYKTYILEAESLKKLTSRMSELVDRISTNHTFFYRESLHFEIFEKKILAQLLKQNQREKKLRVWCAGCSTGEEAYTLQIIIMKVLGAEYEKWDTGVLATDINSEVLKTAFQGYYLKDAIQALPIDYKMIGFENRGDYYSIKPEVRKGVTFKRFNLISEFPFKVQFDTVFCRNVMIYFDLLTKKKLLDKMYSFMKERACFFTSLSEFLDWEELKLTKVHAGIYQKLE
jgi:chemotaxis protein methyltransferase CheR